MKTVWSVMCSTFLKIKNKCLSVSNAISMKWNAVRGPHCSHRLRRPPALVFQKLRAENRIVNINEFYVYVNLIEFIELPVAKFCGII